MSTTVQLGAVLRKPSAGISRSLADRIISRLEEFGEAYFRLPRSPVSDDTYRGSPPRIGRRDHRHRWRENPLTPEHAPRIRAAVQRFGFQLQKTRHEPAPITPAFIHPH